MALLQLCAALTLLIVVTAASTASAASVSAPSTKPNVLFFVVDDLTTALSTFKHPVLTPNFERLKARSMQFNFAYVSVSVCAPSRTAFLTGLRPDLTQVYTIGPYMRNTSHGQGMDIVTLPQYFRQHGYNTTGSGKIFHAGAPSGGISSDEGGGDQCPSSPDGRCSGTTPDPLGSWTEPYWFCDQFVNDTVQSPAMQQWPCANGTWPSCGTGCVQSDACIKCFQDAHTWGVNNLAWAGADCPATCYPESLIADQTVARLRWHAAHPEQPFFTGVGFKRPHLSYKAPRSFFDKYPLDSIEIPHTTTYPEDLPGIAYNHNCMASMQDVVPYGLNMSCTHDRCTEIITNTTMIRQLRAAYYAAVSFTDWALGTVLDALDETGLSSNTIIQLIGDHGYHNGMRGLFCKYSQFEDGVHIPMFISVPPSLGEGYLQNTGSTEIVESIDLFPTLVELAGLPLPKQRFGGVSLKPVLQGQPGGKGFAVSQWPRRPSCTQSHHCLDGHGDPSAATPDVAIMSYSLRRAGWRYTVWIDYNWDKFEPDFGVMHAEELYDHRNDHGDYNSSVTLEVVNLASDPAFASLKTQLHDQLVTVVQAQLGPPMPAEADSV